MAAIKNFEPKKRSYRLWDTILGKVKPNAIQVKLPHSHLVSKLIDCVSSLLCSPW